jgi:acyl-CoA synthetase (AMP-forming)/AMP-acid ligase II
MNEKRKISEEKVWLKYYSEEARNMQLPKCKAFDFVMERNKYRLDTPALHYYGADITYKELRRKVDACARSFTSLGVKPGDIV